MATGDGLQFEDGTEDEQPETVPEQNIHRMEGKTLRDSIAGSLK